MKKQKPGSPSILRFGPFIVTVVPHPDGWRKYTLVVDGQDVQSWMSNPGLEYCQLAVQTAMREGRLSVMRGVQLLRAVSSKRRWEGADQERV